MKAREQNIVKKALAILEKTTGLTADFQAIEPAMVGHTDGKVIITHKQWALHFNVETKARITKATALLDQVAAHGRLEKRLLITEYATPQIAEMLKTADTPFLDAAGNAYLNEPPVYVFITGNKPEKKLKADQPKRLFKPGGLRVVFALLNNPATLNRPYRDIAIAAGVALGTVGWIINDLKERRFVVEMGRKQRKFINFEKLLNRWVEAYPEQLPPKLLKGRFKADNPLWWKEVDIGEYGALWGGEVATTHLTGYLNPGKIIIYTDENPGKLVLKYKLRKANDGEIEIFAPFWPFDDDLADQGVVPPLLIYADLIATGDDRNIEAAGLLYEKYLNRFVREV